MHDMEFDHEHGALSEEEKAEIARYIWAQETVELKTVGIDIGSSTSHLLFAKVTLQRQTQGLSSRFMVIGREVIWRSEVMLTPFLRDDTIDAAALGRFIAGSYKAAGLEKADVDSGAVILTGEAIKRKNARAIDELFAEEAGKFVCATAGHKLECLLAAHGSGAVQLSKDRNVRDTPRRHRRRHDQARADRQGRGARRRRVRGRRALHRDGCQRRVHTRRRQRRRSGKGARPRHVAGIAGEARGAPESCRPTCEDRSRLRARSPARRARAQASC